MKMTESEICREYREAKDKRAQIRILADLNVCEKNQIMKVLLSNGYALPPERKRTDQREDEGYIVPGEEKAKDEPPGGPQSMPESVMIALYARMDELDAAIAVLEKEYKEIAAFVGHYSGEIKTRTA